MYLAIFLPVFHGEKGVLANNYLQLFCCLSGALITELIAAITEMLLAVYCRIHCVLN